MGSGRRIAFVVVALAAAAGLTAGAYRTGRAFEREMVVRDALTLALLDMEDSNFVLRIDGICESGVQVIGRVFPSRDGVAAGKGKPFLWAVGRPFNERPSRVSNPYECRPLRFPLLGEDRAIFYPPDRVH